MLEGCSIFGTNTGCNNDIIACIDGFRMRAGGAMAKAAEIDLGRLVASVTYGPSSGYESVSLHRDRDFYRYIRWASIDLALEDEEAMFLGGEEGEPPQQIARLSGALILGSRAMCEEEDIVDMCDAHSADLLEVMCGLQRAGVLHDELGWTRDAFYIDSFEMMAELIDAPNLREVFDLIPDLLFQCLNATPEVLCYLIASNEDYYGKAVSRTVFDPRSVDASSPDIFQRNGFQADELNKVLYKTCGSIEMDELWDESNDMLGDEEEGVLSDRCAHDGNVEDQDAQEADDPLQQWMEGLAASSMNANRRLLEDYIQVGAGRDIALVPAAASERTVRYVEAAIMASHMGTGLDYALDRFASQEPPHIPEIHRAFQEMYFAGTRHMDATMERMASSEPSAGELFADAALARARNTYYVAGLLYREGHLIEAHAMSRLMLEQMAWAFAVKDVEEPEEAKRIVPTKAIGKLKKKIDPVGKMYGILSNYVHIPIEGHYEFIDLTGEENAVLYQFGAHGYFFGTILGSLADYWSAVYEYTQARHMDSFENWVEEDGMLVLNSDRPFLDVIGPLKEEVVEAYASEYPSYDEFLLKNWRQWEEESDKPNEGGDSELV